MSNYQEVNALIRSFAGQENIIGVPRPFVSFMDSLEGGVFLSQVIFWSDKGGRGDGWFYKSYPSWFDDLHLSEYEVRKWSKKMVEDGYLETRVMKAEGNPTVHYRFDMDKFQESFLKFLRNQTRKSQEPNPKIKASITETTTETTPETTSRKNGGKPPAPSGPTNGRTATGKGEVQQESLLVDVSEEPKSRVVMKPEAGVKLHVQRAYFGAVCKLLGYDPSLITDKDNHVVSGLVTKIRQKEEVYTLSFLERFQADWWASEWRREKRVFPTPRNLFTELGKYASAQALTVEEDGFEPNYLE